MDEQAALRHVSPVIAGSFEKIHAHMCRLEKRIKALEQKQKPAVLIGRPTQSQIERAIHDMNDEA